MATDFSCLPPELRLRIYELANDQTPRVVVEVYDKAKNSYPRTPPPPLLHMNRESTAAVLKICKPWLPQFKGTAAHRPWTVLLPKKSLEKLSRSKHLII